MLISIGAHQESLLLAHFCVHGKTITSNPTPMFSIISTKSVFPSSNYDRILFIVTLLLWMVSSPLIKAQNLRLKHFILVWLGGLKNTVVGVCECGKQNPHYLQGEKIAGIDVWNDI